MMKLYVGLALCYIVACAVVESPTGGIVDEILPYIISVYPSKSTANLASDASIELTFSERIDTAFLKSNITINPRTTEISYHWNWKFDRCTIKPKQTWPKDVTMHFLIGPQIKDYHKVTADTMLEYYHTTEANFSGISLDVAIDTLLVAVMDSSKDSLISDTLKVKKNQLYVFQLYSPVATDTIDFLKRLPDYKVFSRNSQYSFRYLPEDKQQWYILGFIDIDANLKWDGLKEPAAIDSFKGSEIVNIEELSLLVDYSKIYGTIELPDTGNVWLKLQSLASSEERAIIRPDSLGKWKSNNLIPGIYQLLTEFDINLDNKPDSIFTYIQYVDTIKVSIGNQYDLGKIFIKPEETENEQ